MSKVSVIIPARKEPYVNETIRDVMNNAAGEIEVLLILDGWEPEYKIKRRKGLRIFRNKTVEGMRPSINAAAEVATGKYLMKIDAHCSIGEGWDEILKADCDDNWIVIPRRYWWDVEKWYYKVDKYGCISYVDSMTYLYPFLRPYKPRMTCRPNEEKAIQQADQMVVEDMGFQGSLWFMTREHYLDRLGGMDCNGYGTFGEEATEIGLKTQLGPWEGKVIRNKNTWYGHWSKPGIHWKTAPEIAGRVTDEEREASYVYAWDFWWNNKWEDRIHDYEWLVEKFWPLRTWPENWRWLVTKYDRYDLSEL
jgi:glycosyltransferase involved in cell wall biosynthesis